MNPAISKLLSISGEAIGRPVAGTDGFGKWATLGKELAEMLNAKNGFYAFESALLVRPLQNEGAPLGLLEWNAPTLWRGEYLDNPAEALFFAEDVFGVQYCLYADKVCTFDPETAAIEEMSDSIGAWAEEVASEYEFRTGYPLAHAWQADNGALTAGMRLLPKTPFVCGGEYEVANLYALGDVKGMSLRASLANQIRDLPDGAQIEFKIVDDA